VEKWGERKGGLLKQDPPGGKRLKTNMPRPCFLQEESDGVARKAKVLREKSQRIYEHDLPASPINTKLK